MQDGVDDAVADSGFLHFAAADSPSSAATSATTAATAQDLSRT